MINRAIGCILQVGYVLSICVTCVSSLADTTPEQEIVRVNGISIYAVPAAKLITVARASNIEVSKSTASDGLVEYAIADSQLSTEFSNLYDHAISNSRKKKGNIVLQENAEGDTAMLAAIQVHRPRQLVMGVEFFGKFRK